MPNPYRDSKGRFARKAGRGLSKKASSQRNASIKRRVWNHAINLAHGKKVGGRFWKNPSPTKKTAWGTKPPTASSRRKAARTAQNSGGKGNFGGKKIKTGQYRKVSMAVRKAARTIARRPRRKG